MEFIRLENCIKEHDDRIRTLEIADAKIFEKIDTLVKQVSALVKVMWYCIASALSMGIGFILWYIQKGG